MYDLCIIGGGASGMSAAIAAAQRGLKVIILEKNKKLGKKLYATGNGKCNVSNSIMDFNLKYNSSSKHYTEFLEKCLGITPYEQVKEYLESLGVLTYDVNGYCYPKASQASSVVWAMQDRLKEYSVVTALMQEISGILSKDGSFIIKCKDGQITASQIVLACGGRSYPSLGGSTDGYKFAKSFGHTIVPIRPSLCGLITEYALTDIAGVRVSAEASLNDENGTVIAAETGELQINSYGLSGIMIFNLSAKAGAMLDSGRKVYVTVNLIPGIADCDIKKIYVSSLGRTVTGFLNGLVNDKLASYFINRYRLDRKALLRDIDKGTAAKLISELRAFKLEVTGLNDYDSAQVCAGGVDIEEIYPDTMMSRKVPGLYITGELLDIDGLCGGYNLTFAILSGIRAGMSAYDKNKSN